jgi:hypothetical protein
MGATRGTIGQLRPAVGALLLLAFSAAFLWAARPAWAPCHIVQFEPSSYSVGESAGEVTLTVTNNGGQQSQDMHVDYSTANGTARAPSDYTAESGTATFDENGPGLVMIDIPIKNDTGDEPSERFTVTISNVRPSSSCLPPPGNSGSTATVTITDNDPKPQPTLSSAKPTFAPAPSPTRSRTPTPTPSSSATATPTPSQTETASPTPTTTETSVALADEDGGGLSGGALAGIVAAVVVLGGAGTMFVRRRFLA